MARKSIFKGRINEHRDLYFCIRKFSRCFSSLIQRPGFGVVYLKFLPVLFYIYQGVAYIRRMAVCEYYVSIFYQLKDFFVDSILSGGKMFKNFVVGLSSHSLQNVLY